MQLNEYSKYTDYVTVVQDITSSAHAVCSTNLKDKYFLNHRVQLYLAFTVVIPFIIIGIFAAVIRSTHNEIRQKLTESSKDHPILVGLTLTGIYFMFFVIAMDIAALAFYRTDHEYSDFGVDNTFNLFILWITFGFDAIVFLHLLMCMIYLCCFQLRKDGTCLSCTSCCLEKFLPLFFISYFYAIFGSKTQSKMWKEMQSESDGDDKKESPIVKWIVTALMLAPLFSVGSHAGYILIAWVTEPDKTTSAFLVGVGSLVFMFFVFKQCYTLYKIEDDAGRGLFRPCTEVEYSKDCCLNCCCCRPWNHCCNEQAQQAQPPRQIQSFARTVGNCITLRNHWIACFCLVFTIPLLPLWSITSHLANFFSIMAYHLCWKYDDIKDAIEDFELKDVDLGDWKNNKPPKVDRKFSLKAFCMACSWGWLIVGSLALVISSFVFVPLPTFQLAEYLENSVQVVIVVLGVVLTYKIFMVNESDIKKFMKSFRGKPSADEEEGGGIVEDAEHAGYEVRKLADLLKDALQKPNDHQAPSDITYLS